MRVIFNNTEVFHQATDTSLTVFLSTHLLKEKSKVQTYAVALNNTVIAKNNWDKTHVKEGDNIAVFEAIAGG